MITNDLEYQEALRRLKENDAFARRLLIELHRAGLTDTEIDRATQPLYSFFRQWIEEIDEYESKLSEGKPSTS